MKKVKKKMLSLIETGMLVLKSENYENFAAPLLKGHIHDFCQKLFLRF